VKFYTKKFVKYLSKFEFYKKYGNTADFTEKTVEPSVFKSKNFHIKDHSHHLTSHEIYEIFYARKLKFYTKKFVKYLSKFEFYKKYGNTADSTEKTVEPSVCHSKNFHIKDHSHHFTSHEIYEIFYARKLDLWDKIKEVKFS
jgi:hypothetical protein